MKTDKILIKEIKKRAKRLSKYVQGFLYLVDRKDAKEVVRFWKFLDKYEK